MLIGALAQYFFGFTIFVLSTFLVLLVLVQRGRGGGLTGALGGPGGQSAFGTKAGDLFTRITIGVATAWILLCATSVFMLRGRALPQTGGVDRPAIKSGIDAGASSSTTGAGEINSATPKIDLQNLNLPKSDLLEPKPNDAVAPSEGAGVAPPATPEPTPPVPTGADVPPAPK